MGKKNFRGKGNRGGGAPGRGGGSTRGGWGDRSFVVKENEKFQSYYDTLLQLPESEKQELWEALKRELPNSFRFCGSRGHALSVKRLLQTRYIPEIVKIENEEGKSVDPPLAVPWYPDELAWWMTTPKHVVRRFPPFAAFQKFLVSETTIGNISRQEVVSMIPPLLMDLRPGMAVLDMCAAPGSKSAQLLELIHRGEEARVRKVLRSLTTDDGSHLGPVTQDETEADLEADPSDDGRATGLLIANDSDFRRGHMLVHQLKRFSSPNLIVTNHDATQFPSIKLPSPESEPEKQVFLKFDRILADVPCSGDGTLRKNANLWRDWQPGNALGLHLIQTRILVRALQLLKKGGRVVYSTCSMNPVENESVVASAIERCGGPANVEILDCSNELEGLRRKPGLKDWKIMDKSARLWNTWEEVERFTREENEGVVPGRVVQTMFPRREGSECFDLPLDRCIRVYPHLQDTGAFFITVLEKKSEFRARNENDPAQAPLQAQVPQAVGSEAAAAEGSASAGDVKSKREGGLVAETTGDVHGAESHIKNEPGEQAAKDPATTQKETVADDDVASTSSLKRTLDEADGTEQNAAKRVKTEPADADGPKPEEPRIKAGTIDENGLKLQEHSAAAKTTPSAANGKSKKNPPTEEAFKFLDPSHPAIQGIKDFYHLSPRFPDNRYMVRNEMGEPVKAIYYTSALTRDILTENVGRGVRLIHGGVRMFMKQDAPSAGVCNWRIQSEGMPILQGYVGESRVIHLRKKETLRQLLIEMFPRIANEGWKKFDEIGEQVRDVGMGCCVLRVEPDGDDPDFSERMALPLWKSIHSLNLMLPKEDRSAMLLRVYNDTTPLINSGLQKNKVKAVRAETTSSDTGPGAGEGQAADAVVAGEMEVDVEDLPTPQEMKGGVQATMDEQTEEKQVKAEQVAEEQGADEVAELQGDAKEGGQADT